MAEINAVMRYWQISAQDVILMPSPVTHITGYLYALELAFAAGAKAVLMEQWNARDAISLIQAHGASMTVGATPFLFELVAEVERQRTTLSSMRLFASGGAPVPPEVIRRASEALPSCSVTRVYGSSEAPTVTLGVIAPEECMLGATTDGRIVNHDVLIIDPTSGVVSTEGTEGEIVTRGPEVMLGYTDWAETENSFDPDDYFHTGDLGLLSHGEFITITGRLKDLIIRGGENISARDVEDVLHQHPAIRDVAVVAMPHARLGETPCAFVELAVGKTLEMAEVIIFLEQSRIAKQKFPERVEIVDALPRTASGKILKHVLRSRAKDFVPAERRPK
jgi:acyl-CoA synthetase (AMP-forming)/AMP-acid ligase II